MIAIGDIAGQYEALMKLVEKLPPNKGIILLGDLNDRGWQSKEVIQWAMDNAHRVLTLDSNHGDMFVDWYKQHTDPMYIPRYDKEIFEWNGGRATLSSYGHNIDTVTMDALLRDKLLQSHLAFLSLAPSHHMTSINRVDYIFSHAPLLVNPHRKLHQWLDKGQGFTGLNRDTEYNYQWNRYEPDKFHPELPGFVSVFGHNSGNGVKVFCEQYKNGIYVNNDTIEQIMDLNAGMVYGICMDTSRNKCITALDLTTLKMYVEYYPTEAKMY